AALPRPQVDQALLSTTFALSPVRMILKAQKLKRMVRAGFSRLKKHVRWCRTTSAAAVPVVAAADRKGQHRPCGHRSVHPRREGNRWLLIASHLHPCGRLHGEQLN